jgi:hypothetical protein
MSKEDSKVIVRTKEFESFMDKTSKMVERALTGSEDILGPSLFLEGLSEELDGEESSNMLGGIGGSNSRDKLVSLFTFMDEKQTNRTVTSLQWSPTVSIQNDLTLYRSMIFLCVHTASVESTILMRPMA